MIKKCCRGWEGAGVINVRQILALATTTLGNAPSTLHSTHPIAQHTLLHSTPLAIPKTAQCKQDGERRRITSRGNVPAIPCTTHIRQGNQAETDSGQTAWARAMKPGTLPQQERWRHSTLRQESAMDQWWARQVSNLQPTGYEPAALPLSYGPSLQA